MEHRSYANPEAEQKKKAFIPRITQLAKEAGRRDAELGLPLLEEENLVPSLEPQLAELQQHVEEMRDCHKADESVHLGMQALENQQIDAQNKRDEKEAIHREAENAAKNGKSNYPRKMAILLAFGVATLGLLEGLMSIGAIRAFIPSFLTAAVVSLIYGFAMTLLAHQFMNWWYTDGGRFKKIGIRAVLLIGFSLAFFFFGLLRSYHQKLSSLSVEATFDADIFQLASPSEALLFSGISWVIFLPAVLIAQHAPKKDEWIALFRQSALKKEKKKAEAELKQAKAELQKVNDKIDDLLAWDESRGIRAKADEQHAISLIKTIKSNYIQANIRHRKDRQRPKCFDGDFKYYLTTYFQNL